VNDIDAILDAAVFDEVVMADRITAHQHGPRILSACVERGLTYHTLVRMPAHGSGRHHAEALGDGVYLISVETTPQDPVTLSVNRAMDLLGGCVGLVLCAVAFVALAVPIRLASGGAVIFQQTRVGRNGRRFTLYKFRTMRSSAEREQAGLLAANEMSGPLFKLRNDPRVTSVGRWLLRTYLDELPQFWNVLKGDMSLVGTRPPTPEEVSRYSPSERRRLSVRPGITGLWQIQGNGSVTDFDTVVRLDCDYIDRWSLLLDLKILLQTCATVARRAGH
jgi:lipopolysaccharide/colanic/teichoic acid biosynthesis glycosyltransferase